VLPWGIHNFTSGLQYPLTSRSFKSIPTGYNFLLCHIFGQKNSCHDLWSDPFKKVRNILTRAQLIVAHEGPCSTEPVNTFKKQRTLSCILNKAGDVLGMGKNYMMQNNI
jgi:hypothetical protein